MEDLTNNLLLVKPSKALEKEILEYKQEYFDFGETGVNGSCGLACYDNFNEWLNLVLSIEKDKLRNGVHTSTFFSIRKEDDKIIGSIKLHHFLTPYLVLSGILSGSKPYLIQSN